MSEATAGTEDLFRLIFEAAPIGMAVVDLDGRFTRVNRALSETLGYSPEELVAKTLRDVTYPDDLALSSALNERLLAGDVPSGQLEKRYLRKDGTVVHALLQMSVVRESAGRPRHFIAQIVNVADRASYRALVEDAAYGIYRSTPGGSFVSVNPAMVKMLGYELEAEVLALDIGRDVYVDSELREHLIAQYRDADRIQEVEAEWRRKDGSTFLVRLAGRPIRNAGEELEAFEMIAEDVTERRALEEQLRQAQKMEAVGQLTGGIAHDFNNLLTVILANADIIERGLPQGDIQLREDVADLRRAAQRGSDMVKMLMGYSRRGVLSLRSINVASLVTDMLPRLRRVIPEHITVRLIPRAPDATIRADGGALEQILFNLATNSRDAMPQGGALRIEISRASMDDESPELKEWGASGEYVQLSVTDTGHGMDEATRRQVFHPFFTTKPPGMGTGLGMSMIYGLVKQQRGFIDIQSTPGEGTTVKLYFPAVEDAAVALSDSLGIDAWGGTETILLAEDEPAIRRSAKRLLEKKGYTVLLASDGHEALEVFRLHEPEIDLIISDVVMPRLGGLQLYEALRLRGKTTRFLFTSGYTPHDVRGSTLDPKLPFLQKPWDVDELLRRVRELLDAA